MRSAWRTARALTSLAYRASPGRFWFHVIAGVLINGPMPLLGAVFAGHMINEFLHDATGRATTSAVLVGLVTAAQFALSRFWRINLIVLQDRIAALLDREMIEMSTGVAGIAHLENPIYLDKLELLRFEPQMVGIAAWGVPTTALNLVVFAAMLVVILSAVSPVLIGLPPVAAGCLLATSRFRRQEHRVFAQTAEPRRLANQFFDLATNPARAEEMRTLRIGDELVRRHTDAWGRSDRALRSAEIRSAIVTVVAGVVMNAAYLAAIVFVAERGIAGRVSPGDVVLTVVVAGVLAQGLQRYFETFSVLARGIATAANYVWLRDYERDHRPDREGHRAPDVLLDGIRFEGVSFRYPGTERAVFEGLDLHLPAGAVVAIVGDNGTGKTTLVKLVTGMYPPDRGAITVDGTALSDLDLASWRARSSAAFQDYARFDLTAQHGVGVGDLPHLDDRERVVTALDRAGAADLPAALDRGLDTTLGPSLDGAQLSGGQWQKLALGRSMMRNEPLIVVFDEPAASLDPDAERALFERWASRARETSRHGTITLIVTHRFSSVRIADLIIVIDGDGVREVGSHAELMARQGLYAELYQLQATGYA